MDGLKLNALCVKAVDYKDNKTLLTLCTIEKGKIGAAISGVKSEKSKLRFAASLLCFGEYIFSERGGRYTVTGCTLTDGFFEARNGVERLYSALAVTEILDKTTEEHTDISANIYSALNALKNIAYGENPLGALLEYTVAASAEAGYAIDLKTCAGCGAPAAEGWFDAETGGGVCGACRTRNSVGMSKGAFRLLYNTVYNKKRGIEPRENGVLNSANSGAKTQKNDALNSEDIGAKAQGNEVFSSENSGAKTRRNDALNSGNGSIEIHKNDLEDNLYECLRVVNSYFSACNEVRINALNQLLSLRFFK
ncbi:MAG: DNA repair protein RecO [Clostridiales bacterium]|jgi:DNA repair protein RecO (recombination protein O)|nr:DNA repair protein RecO [Clostridiales bacterium]